MQEAKSPELRKILAQTTSKNLSREEIEKRLPFLISNTTSFDAEEKVYWTELLEEWAMDDTQVGKLYDILFNESEWEKFLEQNYWKEIRKLNVAHREKYEQVGKK